MEIPKFNVRTNAGGDETYTRCSGVNCSFTDGRIPEVFFLRENKTTSASGAMTQYESLPALSVPYDPAGTFPVVNPITGAVTSMSHDEFLWIFYQFWVSAEAARLAAEQAQATPAPEPPA